MLSLLKKLFILALIVVIGTFVTDYLLVMRFNKDSMFTFKEKDNIKYGLIYKIKTENNKNIFYIFNFQIDESEIETVEKKLEIIDKTGTRCKEIKTYFYEDDENKYYFDCMKDYYVKINSIEYTLKNALENNLISIEDVKNNNIDFKTEKKSNN